MIKDHVVVYELPSMYVMLDERIDKRVGIKIDNIIKFSWNPAKNMFCYLFEIIKSKGSDKDKDKDLPKIGFIDIPSREVWDEKEIINGDNVKMEWSADGTKLIAMCKLKKKKEYLNNVQIFDVTSRGIPTDIIKVDTSIMSVEWTSVTNRLAILANNQKKIREKWEENAQVSKVAIYDIVQDKHTLISTRIGSSKEHISNNVKWSENGNIFVASDIKNSTPTQQGKFYVYYVRTVVSRVEVNNQGKKKKKGKPTFEEKREYVVDSVNDVDHPRDEWIKWDPTSRFFVTGKLPKGFVKVPPPGTTFKFSIHDAKGELLYSYSNLKLQQFEWRPRPIRTWTEKNNREFKKEYKKDLRRVIIENDEKSKNEHLEYSRLLKEKTKEKFFEIVTPLQKKYHETKDKRREIGMEDESGDEQEFTRSVIIDYY